MTVGRNDPCPCGSGKKYKKCCMLKAKTSAPSLTVHRLRKANDEVSPLLLGYARRIYGEESIFAAWEAFWSTGGEPEEDPFSESPYLQLFIPWFLYHWYPDENEAYTAEVEFPSRHTVVAQFLQRRGKTVDAFTRRYLECAQREPLTFWEVQAVEPGKGMLLRDLVIGRERFVHEVSGSQMIKKWDILLGQVMGLDGEYILGATCPYPLSPSRFREQIAAFIEDIQGESALTPVDLLEYDGDFLACYHQCVKARMHAPLPELRNTDGEELVFTTSSYAFDPSRRENILFELRSMRSLEQMEEEEFVWMVKNRGRAMMQEVSKGHIQVSSDHLVTQCNSEARDRTLRNRLERRLGDLMEYESSTREALDWDNLPEAPEGSGPLDLDTLPAEEREALEGVMEQQYMRWADERVPALGNKTPREAVKTVAGRERVVGLINDWENSQLRMPDPQFRFDFNKLRKVLGLDAE